MFIKFMGPPNAVLSSNVYKGPGFNIPSDHILSFLVLLIQKKAVVSYRRKYVHLAYDKKKGWGEGVGAIHPHFPSISM